MLDLFSDLNRLLDGRREDRRRWKTGMQTLLEGGKQILNRQTFKALSSLLSFLIDLIDRQVLCGKFLKCLTIQYCQTGKQTLVEGRKADSDGKQESRHWGTFGKHKK